MTIVTS